MTKDDEDFENPTKCWNCNNVYVEADNNVRDHFHIMRKYRGSVQRDCYIKLN